jgi:hypothetical protein
MCHPICYVSIVPQQHGHLGYLWRMIRQPILWLPHWYLKLFSLVSINHSLCSCKSNNRHVAPLGHIILIPSQSVFLLFHECCTLSRQSTNTICIVFGLTRSGLEPTIYHTRGEHANHNTTVCYVSIVPQQHGHLGYLWRMIRQPILWLPHWYLKLFSLVSINHSLCRN